MTHTEKLVHSVVSYVEKHHRLQWNLLSDANSNIVSLCTGEQDLLPAIARQARAIRLGDAQQKADGIELPNRRAQYYIGPMKNSVKIVKSSRAGSIALETQQRAGACCLLEAKLPPRICLLQYEYTTPKAIIPGKHFLPETDLTRCLRDFDDETHRKSRGKKRSYAINLMFNFVKSKLLTVQQVAQKGNKWFKEAAHIEVVGFTDKRLWKHIKKVASSQLKQREILYEEQLKDESERPVATEVKPGLSNMPELPVDTDSEVKKSGSEHPNNSEDMASANPIDTDNDIQDVDDISASNRLNTEYENMNGVSEDRGDVGKSEAPQQSENKNDPVVNTAKSTSDDIDEDPSTNKISISEAPVTKSLSGNGRTSSLAADEAVANLDADGRSVFLDENAVKESIVPEGMTTEPEAVSMFEKLDLESNRKPKHVVYISRDNDYDTKPRHKGQLVSLLSERGKELFVRKLIKDMPHLSFPQACQFRDQLLDQHRQEVESEEKFRQENEIYRVDLPYVVFGSYCIGSTWYLVMDFRYDSPSASHRTRACKQYCTLCCLRRCCGGLGCGCCVAPETIDHERSGIVSNFSPTSTRDLFIDLVYEAESIRSKFLRIFEIRRKRHGYRIPYEQWKRVVGSQQHLQNTPGGNPSINKISSIEIGKSTDSTKTLDGTEEAGATFLNIDSKPNDNTLEETAAPKDKSEAIVANEQSSVEQWTVDFFEEEAEYADLSVPADEEAPTSKETKLREKQEAKAFRNARKDIIKRFPENEFRYLYQMELSLRGISRLHAEHLRATVHGQLLIDGASDNEDPVEIAAQASTKIAEDKEIAQLGQPKDESGVDDVYAQQTMLAEPGKEDSLSESPFPELDRLGSEVQLNYLATVQCCQEAEITLPIIMESMQIPRRRRRHMISLICGPFIWLLRAMLFSWCCMCAPCFSTGVVGSFCDKDKKSGARGIKDLERDLQMKARAKSLVKQKREAYILAKGGSAKKSKYCV